MPTKRTRPQRAAALLIAVLLLCPLWTTSASAAPTGGSVSVRQMERIAADYPKVSNSFLNEISGQGEISVSRLKQYAKTYALPAQYLQRFLDDEFVFKMGNDYQYISVDPTLKQNDYNWDYLYDGYGEKGYRWDGLHEAVKCIDVSTHQGYINWNSVKADGVDYAYIRLGYRGYGNGSMNLDARYYENIENAKAAGVKVGVYFYSSAINRWEAEEEALFVLKHIKGYTMDLPVVFDVEGAPTRYARTAGLGTQRYTNIINGFCDTIQNAGYETMVYSYCKFILESLDLNQLQNHKLWLAEYYQVPFFPYEFAMWQYSATGRVAGIAKDVDLNLMFIPLAVEEVATAVVIERVD